MEQTKLISVIVPVYNVESYLRECVESVLGQSYPHFELLLVDDGSTDRSGEICDEYAAKDERVKVIHQKNGGASAARNTGLDAATGEYLFFLDSDDRILPQTFEKMTATLEESAADFVFCEAVAVDETTGEESLTNYGYRRDYGVGDPRAFFEEMTAHREFHVAVWMLLYRRSFLTGKKLRFIEGMMSEDLLFAFQVYCLAGKAAHVREYLYVRRYRAGSVTTSQKKAYAFRSAKRAYEETVAFSEQVPEVKADRYLARIAGMTLGTYRALGRDDKKNCRAEYRAVRADILRRNGFGDRSLRANCRGKVFWLAEKAVEKVLH